MYGHPTQQVGTEDISQSAGDRKLRLGRWAREKRVVFNFRDGNCLYEQTCRKHHQTPSATRFSSANSLPDKQFHARVFALHQSERGLEVNVSRFCRGKSIFKYYPRPDPSLHNAPPTHAGPVHSAIPGSGHNHTHRRTSSATAKRLYVLGAARTRHLPALEFPAQCSLWPVYSRRLRSPESAPSARL